MLAEKRLVETGNSGSQPYFEILIGHGLILRVHSLGWWAGELTDGDEDDGRDSDAEHGVPEDLFPLAGWRKGARAVRTEGDPVCYPEDELAPERRNRILSDA